MRRAGAHCCEDGGRHGSVYENKICDHAQGDGRVFAVLALFNGERSMRARTHACARVCSCAYGRWCLVGP